MRVLEFTSLIMKFFGENRPPAKAQVKKARSRMNYQSKTFRLYFEGKLIGTVGDIFYETPEFSGYLSPEPAFEDIRSDMFFMTDDSADEVEGNVDKRFEMIEQYDHDWFFEDESGEREQVYMPAIDEQLVVIWRWCEPHYINEATSMS